MTCQACGNSSGKTFSHTSDRNDKKKVRNLLPLILQKTPTRFHSQLREIEKLINELESLSFYDNVILAQEQSEELIKSFFQEEGRILENDEKLTLCEDCNNELTRRGLEIDENLNSKYSSEQLNRIEEIFKEMERLFSDWSSLIETELGKDWLERLDGELKNESPLYRKEREKIKKHNSRERERQETPPEQEPRQTLPPKNNTQYLEQINRVEGQISSIQSQINNLQNSSNPDLTQIRGLQSNLDNLQKQLKQLKKPNSNKQAQPSEKNNHKPLIALAILLVVSLAIFGLIFSRKKNNRN